MDKEKARFNMIEQQIRTWNVLNTEVLALLSHVKREHYVPAMYRDLAFADLELPLTAGGQLHGQVMLMPKIEARVLQELAIQPHETVLEIGAGSGYMAALMAHQAQQVISVEIAPELVAMARHNLTSNGVSNVQVVEGDGARGWDSAVSYDVICVSGGLATLPPSLMQQLKPGGRLLAFIGSEPLMEMLLITRLDTGTYQTRQILETQVPMLQGGPQPSRFRF